MAALNDSQIDAIAQRVMEKMHGGARALKPAQSESVARGGSLPLGVFRSIDDCVEAARAAFKEFGKLGLEARHKIIASIRETMLAHAISLARDAQEETGLGRVDDKIIKNRLVTNKTPGPEILEPRAWSGDNGLTIMERAPF